MKLLFSFILLLFLFSCSKKESIEKKFQNPYYDIAKKYRDNGKADSAFIVFNQAKEFGLENSDSLSVASSLINMAILLTNAGDYFGGQETSLQANKYLNENNPKHHYYLGSNYNNLGIATYNLKDYKNSLKLYNLAIKFSDDSLDTRMYLNNQAKVFQEIKDYKSALKIYDQILAKTAKNENEYARVLTNIAKTKWLENPAYNPIPDFLKSLQIRKRENDLWGQNSSYAHLSDYYTSKRPDSALNCALIRYRIAQKLNSPTDKLEALQKLIKLSSYIKTKQYFEIYQQLDDSIQNARNAAKNQFALVRYETEKNKADFLKAQAENIEKQKDILLRNIEIVTLVICLILGYYLYQRRQKSLQQEKEIEVKKTELKYIKKVHDGVANGLYRIMNKLDNQEALKDNPIINEIEELYEQSRDISYERPRSKNQPFNEKIAEVLKSFASESTRVILVGNSTPLWEKVSEQAKDEVEHILQELMVNMDKHSQASDVVIKFEQVQQKINIYYTDNGIGISGKVQANNGLTNTGTRIAAIDGTITFDTNVEKGLKIRISFPVS
ncbi:tetratricopeptide repeat-containing sensor histidine kinase [Pedobacter sp. ISL-64]|uniref:tetratricopeptide repeat-containing sensor histidine kinase n=1 Tax=Pedobacter sp. ISL-64 TaxID=2819164 RepID=UPI00203562D4|nr:tetratricopeptide repeat-containing sensor histidine kinase [Pedobacter sp. ISL-64]